MAGSFHRLFFYVLPILSTSVLHSESKPACGPEVEECEFWLHIEERLASMKGKDLLVPHNGKLYRYDVIDFNTSEPVSLDGVIPTDGHYELPRRVVVANGSLPGPAIEVYEGQTVVVHVKNLLKGQGVTVHWHGLHQKGTPHMDGVAFITQCPIMPGQSFTYRFKALPKGTFWYHSHIGSQRSDGLYGAFIIHEKPVNSNNEQSEEFIMQLSDWNHDWDSDVSYLKMLYGIYDGKTKYSGSRSLEGAFFSMFKFQSGLINGKGRYYDPVTEKHNQAPLEVFTATAGKTYRFRVIAAGALYPFRVSVDAHPVTVIASDGYDLEPITAESFIINPGERFDFLITTNQSIDNYWIRAVTLESNKKNHIAEAILHYSGAEVDKEPTTSPQTCTESEPCLVVNCPFSYFPWKAYTNCITFDNLKSKVAMPAPSKSGGEFKEVFMNFAFPGTTHTPGSVNGRAFELPDVSALSQFGDITNHCNPEECGSQKTCSCSYRMDLEYGDVVQMVWTNLGSGKGWSHPIHLHGHSFYVLKMGYAKYNKTSAMLMGDNEDIDCRESFCNDATWRNQTWLNGNVPGLNLDTPPRKDTLIIPTGGYAVVQIKADNPGLWFMHCHIELHALDGMAMMLYEAPDKIPKTPAGFPKCGSFHYDQHQDSPETDPTAKPMTTSPPDTATQTAKDFLTEQTFWIGFGVLAAILIVQFIIILFLACRSNGNSHGADGRDNKGFSRE